MSSNVAITRCVVAELNPEKRYVATKNSENSMLRVAAIEHALYCFSLCLQMQACLSVPSLVDY